MVGHAALREVVSAYTVRAVTTANEAFALRRFFGFAHTALGFCDARHQHLHSLGAVAVLRAVVLALGDRASWNMSNAYCRVGFIHVLTTRAAGAVGVNAQVRWVNLYSLCLVRFRHHRDGTSAGMNSTLRFSGGYALHTVTARLEAEFAVGLLANEAHDHFFVAAQLAVGFADQFHTQAG